VDTEVTEPEARACGEKSLHGLTASSPTTRMPVGHGLPEVAQADVMEEIVQEQSAPMPSPPLAAGVAAPLWAL